MKFAVLIALMFGASLVSSAADPATAEHTAWVVHSLQDMKSVEVGMTRADVEKIFKQIGGISTPQERTYAYRGCPYFLVDVRYAKTSQLTKDDIGRPDDKVVMISRPYLDWPAGD